MSIPGFDAESSLGPTMGRYRGKAVFSASGAAEGLSMQVSPMALDTLLASRFDLFPPIRCCGYVQMLHRFVCVTRRASPWEQCRCTRDFFGFPIILCSPPVIATLSSE